MGSRMNINRRKLWRTATRRWRKLGAVLSTKFSHSSNTYSMKMGNFTSRYTSIKQREDIVATCRGEGSHGESGWFQVIVMHFLVLFQHPEIMQSHDSIL